MGDGNWLNLQPLRAADGICHCNAEFFVFGTIFFAMDSAFPDMYSLVRCVFIVKFVCSLFAQWISSSEMGTYHHPKQCLWANLIKNHSYRFIGS